VNANSRSLTARAVLFDLDGTLIDTAPDLGYAANRVRAEAGLGPLSLGEYRPHASNGARGLLGRALGVTPESPGYDELRERFLVHYRAHLSRGSRPFPGIDALLHSIEAAGGLWGVVTNKVRELTEPLMRDLGLSERAACVVSADDVANPKPAPDALLHALEMIGARSDEAIYIGDDLRDINAARAAGVRSVAAGWGYLGDTVSIDHWNADVIAEDVASLNAMLVIGATA